VLTVQEVFCCTRLVTGVRLSSLWVCTKVKVKVQVKVKVTLEQSTKAQRGIKLYYDINNVRQHNCFCYTS